MASPQFPPVDSDNFVKLIDMYVKCEEDTYAEKIDMIPGAYRDEHGKPWVMPFVRDVEKKLSQSTSYNHEYVFCLGTDPFNKLVSELVLGKNSSALKSGRAFGIQTAGGSGALRIGAELLVRHSKYTTFYVSDPTWDITEKMFTHGGFTNSCHYRYWDPIKRGVDFKGLIEDLSKAPEYAVIVLQMCAHNPTGCDLTKEQWIKIADLMQEKKLFPFFDAAYQGFASGDVEEDAWPLRYFVERGFEMFIAQTFSKSMGLYGDRIGSLVVVLNEGRQKEIGAIKMMLTIIVAALYLSPTRRGAEIVNQTMQDPALCEQWHECLKTILSRLKTVRQGLRDRLVKLRTPGNWDHIATQNGMFSYTGLSSKQVDYLAQEYHIYLLPNGRANICALNSNNLDRVARAIHNAVINVSG